MSITKAQAKRIVLDVLAEIALDKSVGPEWRIAAVGGLYGYAVPRSERSPACTAGTPKDGPKDAPADKEGD